MERQQLFAEFVSNQGDEFIQLHRDDCLFTNSLFVEEANQAEKHFLPLSSNIETEKDDVLRRRTDKIVD
jgi:hypothetical protein